MTEIEDYYREYMNEISIIKTQRPGREVKKNYRFQVTRCQQVCKN